LLLRVNNKVNGARRPQLAFSKRTRSLGH
jgi:hypothetical protein